MKTIATLLAEHPFSRTLSAEHRSIIAGCGANMRFDAGRLLARAETPAERFYLIREGRVSIEIRDPARGAIPVETIADGDVLGWSWLVPPFRWVFDARAVEPCGVIAFDGTCLRAKCSGDPEFGHALLRQVTEVLARRLAGTRMQILDLYGDDVRSDGRSR